MYRYLLICILCYGLPANAQFTYVDEQSIPVSNQAGEILPLAWSGGLNASQFNTIDLNFDGHEDLVIFDRMTNKVITFLNDNGRHIYAPDYESLFPPEAERFLLLKDFNCDGRKDIFTGDPLGIKVYSNTSEESITWEQFMFTTQTGGKRPVILTKGFNLTNLQIQPDDLPAIVDADGDGDLDIFNMRYPSGATIEYHQNLSMEKYGSCDSLEFERITQTWGGVTECECGVFAFNNEDCDAGGRTKHQGGKALLAIHANDDDIIDLLVSEADCDQVFLLQNTGSFNDPIITDATTFPETNAISLTTFPAVYYEDVNFDGKKDLISAPNLYSKEHLTINLKSSSWLYQNIGSNEHPELEFVTENFLQSDMIDVGDNAVPAFADANGDGDYDLFISNNSEIDTKSRIYFYENIGTLDEPAFKLIDDNFLSFSDKSFYNLKIHFHDLNRDGRKDLIFTATNADDGSTKLYIIPNTNAAGLTLNGSPEIIPFNFTSGENLSFVDVNQDGAIDLLVGRSSGAVEYWRSTSTSGLPAFSLADNAYIPADPNSLTQSIATTSGDFNADNKTDLVLGDQRGILKIISDFRTKENRTTVITEIIYNERLEKYTARNLGGRLWPTVVNLFATDKPAIVIGNILGGLRVLRNDNGNSLPHTLRITVTPNPIRSGERIKIQSVRDVKLEIVNALGQQVSLPDTMLSGSIEHFVNVNLPAGLYFLKFVSHSSTSTQRLIIY